MNQREIKKDNRVWWAVLTDSKGWERRLKIPPRECPPIFRYPTKQNNYDLLKQTGVATFVKQIEYETIEFERQTKQETDTAVYIYYAEVE